MHNALKFSVTYFNIVSGHNIDFHIFYVNDKNDTNEELEGAGDRGRRDCDGLSKCMHTDSA